MSRFTHLTNFAILASLSTFLQAGCRDDAPPPPRVLVPAANNHDRLHEREDVKPMPSEDGRQR